MYIFSRGLGEQAFLHIDNTIMTYDHYFALQIIPFSLPFLLYRVGPTFDYRSEVTRSACRSEFGPLRMAHVYSTYMHSLLLLPCAGPIESRQV